MVCGEAHLTGSANCKGKFRRLQRPGNQQAAPRNKTSKASGNGGSSSGKSGQATGPAPVNKTSKKNKNLNAPGQSVKTPLSQEGDFSPLDTSNAATTSKAGWTRNAATTTTAKCRTRKLRDATSFLRKGDAPSTPRRTRRATKTSAFPRRTPRAKTDKAENGTNLPASNDVPPQYEATQQTAAAIFSPQTSSATATEGAPAIPPFPKNGKECNQGETELEENLSSLPRQESYRNTSHEFPSPSSCSQVTPAFSPPAVSTAESSPTGSPPAPSAATASPPEQAREAAATANSPGALFPPAPNPDKSLFALASALSVRSGVIKERVKSSRNIVAADVSPQECLKEPLGVTELCGIAVSSRIPACRGYTTE
ncbi:hypothetical protein HPB52_022474 [Rhipicephalus sanguineus]|uniref:Uncharacterized protein n=1 Tax=Rhipicephalus sanguineus TaxID=34632 RepID=A0A9D4T225_RHISA|nr:hypothetical protein HPB52_022474 [Rhipicephalus sanguineus]